MSCNAAETPNTGDEPTAVEQRLVASADGLQVSYEVRGRGETALVFVHCWACDRTFWHRQLDEFAGEYRIVAIDLGGHGQSGSNRDNWTLSSLADDVVAVVDELQLSRFVLIGHSMGGPVALDVAARLPERVRAVIAVDTLHDAEAKPPEGMLEQILEGYRKDFEGSMEQFIAALIHPDSPEETRKWILEKALSVDREAVLAVFGTFAGYDLASSLQKVKVPIRCINAAERAPMIPATATEVNRKYADFDAKIIPDVGHYPLLEKPEEFNRKLRETLQELE